MATRFALSSVAGAAAPGARPSASPSDRSPLVDRANTALRAAWRRGWSERPSLDPALLLHKAGQSLTSVSMADREDWLARLTDLTAALEREARLNPLGRTVAHGQIVRIIRQRLRLEALWRARPEIFAMPVPAPIIVLGQMRSGTTRVQRLLAADPRLAATRFCDGWNAVPPRGPDLRPLGAWAALQLIHRINPRFAAIHPTSARSADEEIGWLALGLSTTPFDAQWRIPSFVAANEARDAAPVYRLLRRIVQTDIWARGGDPRPRILKVPQFMEDAGALLDCFPDARIVRVTRDPVAVVASSASLVANQMAVQSDALCPASIGREWLRKTVRREERARERLARADVGMVTVDYAEVDADWRGALARIYRLIGLPLDAATLARQTKHAGKPVAAGAHRYDLESFGLSAAQIRRACADQPTISSGLKK